MASIKIKSQNQVRKCVFAPNKIFNVGFVVFGHLKFKYPPHENKNKTK